MDGACCASRTHAELCSTSHYMQANKVVVVVGGCGFLGRHLVEGLVARGYRVRVFDLCTSFSHEGVEFYTGNLCEKEVYSERLCFYDVM